MKKKTFTKIILIIVAFIAFLVLTGSLFTVRYNHYSLVKEFGKVVRVIDEPGLYFKIPIIQSTQEIFKGSRNYDIPASDVITKDKKSMIADDYVIWSVSDAKKFYQTLGAVDARAEERIDAAVYNATKNTISSMTQDEVIAARGIELTRIITQEANTDISSYGIEIKMAEIKALDLPDDNKQAVYERMISERRNIAAGYKAKGDAEAQKIKNETDKEVTVKLAQANKEAEQIVAEGEAEYMKILSDAYNNTEKADFYNYIRSLDALKASLKGSNKTIMLDKNSEIARILYGNY